MRKLKMKSLTFNSELHHFKYIRARPIQFKEPNCFVLSRHRFELERHRARKGSRVKNHESRVKSNNQRDQRPKR